MSLSLRIGNAARLMRAAGRCRRGIAMVEFVLALPLFLVLVMGGLEIANMAIAQQRVTEIASDVAENAARGTEEIDESQIQEIFTGAQLAAAGTSILSNGRIILSSVRLNSAKNGQWIEWQRCDGDGTGFVSVYGAQGKGQSDASLQQIGAAPGIRAADGVDIMVVEVRTRYQPLIGGLFASVAGNRTLSATAAHVVRERTTFGIKNDGNIPQSQIKTC